MESNIVNVLKMYKTIEALVEAGKQGPLIGTSTREHMSVMVALKPKHKHMKTLRQARKRVFPIIKSPFDLPPMYKQTLSSFLARTNERSIFVLKLFESIQLILWHCELKKMENTSGHEHVRPRVANWNLRWQLKTDEGSGILIFASDEDMLAGAMSKNIVADGTFKTCPLPFCQLYVLHAEVIAFQSYIGH